MTTLIYRSWNDMLGLYGTQYVYMLGACMFLIKNPIRFRVPLKINKWNEIHTTKIGCNKINGWSNNNGHITMDTYRSYIKYVWVCVFKCLSKQNGWARKKACQMTKIKINTRRNRFLLFIKWNAISMSFGWHSLFRCPSQLLSIRMCCFVCFCSVRYDHFAHANQFDCVYLPSLRWIDINSINNN